MPTANQQKAYVQVPQRLEKLIKNFIYPDDWFIQLGQFAADTLKLTDNAKVKFFI